MSEDQADGFAEQYEPASPLPSEVGYLTTPTVKLVRLSDTSVLVQVMDRHGVACVRVHMDEEWRLERRHGVWIPVLV